MTTTEARVVIGADVTGLQRGAAAAATAVQGVGRASVVSAGQTRAAFQQLPAQFTDIATQLAGGQSPLLILLQQGGQIKDSFGGITNTFRAFASVLNPVKIAAGGVAVALGGIAFAAISGFRESNRLRDALILTGNAAGQTADSVTASAERISSSTGQTLGSVRAIVTALAASGRTTGEVIEGQARAIARLADLTGQAGAQLSGQFADQFKAPTEAAARLNEQYNFLNIEQFKRIQQLEREGQAVAAVNLTNSLLETQLAQQASQLGTLERAWDGLGKAVSRAVQALKDIGRPETTGNAIEGQLSALQDLQRRLAESEASGRGPVTPARQRVQDNLRRQIAETQQSLVALQRRQDVENTNAAARSSDAARARTEIAAALRPTPQPRAPRAERPQLDRLGDFITERVLPDDTARQEARIKREEDYLRRVTEANDRAATRLLEDERARGLALIELDRAQALQRLEEAELSAERRVEVQAQITRAAALQTEALNRELATKDRERLNAQATYLQQLVDANERAGLQLIADERQRARAIIELDRSLAVRRLNQAELSAEARAQALAEIDRGAAIQNEVLAKQSADKLSEFSRQAASNIQDALGSSLVQLLRGDFKSIERLWKDTITVLIAQAAAAQLNRALFGDDFGATGKLGGFLGSILQGVVGAVTGSRTPAPAASAPQGGVSTFVQGRRATGGRVQRGVPYLVGELRPERFVPDVSGYVQPDAMAGGTRIDYAPVFNINGDISPQTVALVRAEARAQQEELLRRLARQGKL